MVHCSLVIQTDTGSPPPQLSPVSEAVSNKGQASHLSIGYFPSFFSIPVNFCHELLERPVLKADGLFRKVSHRLIKVEINQGVGTKMIGPEKMCIRDRRSNLLMTV